jgi:hypothetical protein
VPTAAARSVADFMLAGRVPDLQALEPWYTAHTAGNIKKLLALEPFMVSQRYLPQVHGTQPINF